jgi:hypothetical protein
MSGEISHNRITLSSSSASQNGIAGINIPAAVNGPLSITDNIIENCRFNGATTAPFTGINSAFSGNGLQRIAGNKIRNNVLSNATNGTFNGIKVSGNPAALNIDSNEVTGNRYSGIGAMNLIQVSDSLITYRVGWNKISDNKKTGTSGTFNGILINSPSDNTIINNEITDNGISAANGSVQNTVTGINHVAGNGAESVTGNIIRKLFVEGTSTGTVQVSAIRNFNFASQRTVTGNKIDSIYSAQSATVIAINAINSSGPNLIQNNRISDLTAGGSGGIATGIFTSAISAQLTISNNYIGNLFTPLSANPSGVRGMELNGQSVIGVYFNTVRLSAESNSSLFGSSGVLANFTCQLDMRNNIIINSSVPGGVGGADGVTAAYRRNSSNLTTYLQTSNRNIFYAGIPGDNNLIYCEGLGNTVSNPKITVADYKQYPGLAPRDNASATENVSFLSLTGTSNTFLHVNPTQLTAVEGNALPVAGITADYDGDPRNPGTPDIGADENAFMGAGPTVSSVAAVPPGGSCSAVSHTINAVVIGGINPLTSVTLSYAFNGVAQGILPMTHTNGNNWEVAVPAANPSGAVVSITVAATDGIYSQNLAYSYRDEILTQYSLGIQASSASPFVCGSDTVRLNAVVNGNAQPSNNYCMPVHQSTGNCITSVSLNTILNNTSQQSCTLPSYTLFPQTGQTTTSLIAGKNYLLKVNTISNSMVWAWLDFNANGVFESSEGFLVYTSATGGQITLPVPASANVGGTVLRIRSTNANGSMNRNDACSGALSGETEDYIINIIPDLLFTWSPSNGLSSVNVANPLATVSTTTTYTVTATDSNGCTLPSLTSNISVNSIAPPASPSATNSVQCGAGVPGCSVSSAAASYNWYLNQSGGQPIAGEHGNSLSSYSIQSTKSFWVAAVDGTCESARTQVIATVNQPDSVRAISSVTVA